MPDTSFWQWLIAHRSAGCVLVFHDIPAASFADFISNLGLPHLVHLDELLARAHAHRSTAGLFAITVDDGVGTTLHDLSAVCIARSWPATFFLPTAAVESGEVLPFQWFRALLPILPRRLLLLPSGPLDLRPPNALERLFLRLQRLWHSAPTPAYSPLISELVEFVTQETGLPPSAFQPPSPVSWEVVESLARHDVIRFESHGVSHTAMCALSEPELLRELQSSRDTVALHTGRPCRHLAYPFGSPTSIGPLAPSLAARFYDSASTMTMGPVESADPFLLPRIPIHPENSLYKARAKILLRGAAQVLHHPLPIMPDRRSAL